MFKADLGDAMGYVSDGKKQYQRQVNKGRKRGIQASGWATQAAQQHNRWGQDEMNRIGMQTNKAFQDTYNPFYQTGVQATNQYNDLMSGAADQGLINQNQAAIDFARKNNDRAQNARGSFYAGEGIDSDARVLNQQIGDIRGQHAQILGQGMQVGLQGAAGMGQGFMAEQGMRAAGNQLYAGATARNALDQNNWRRDMDYGHGQLLGNSEMWAAGQLANLSGTESLTNAKMGNALLGQLIGAGTSMLKPPGTGTLTS